MSELPSGWETVNLAEIGEWSSGGTPSRRNPDYFGPGVPWIKSGDLPDGPIKSVQEEITELGLQNSAAKLLPVGTISVALYGGTIGKVGVLTFPAATNQACANVVPDEVVVKREYLFFYLLSEKQNLINKGQGGAQPNISQEILKAHPIPLAPLKEQERIVEKVEGALERFALAKAKLDRVSSILEHLRRLILSAACSGALTREWRENNRESLSSWQIRTRVSDVTEDISYGFTAPSTQKDTGTKFLRITDIQDNRVNWETVPYCQIEPRAAQKYKLSNGDIVFARTGATTGKSFLVGECPNAVFASYLIRVQSSPKVIPNYLWLFFQTPAYWEQISENISGSAQPSCNASKLGSLVFDLPSLSEQREIVRVANELFSLADSIEARLSQVEVLLQRIPSTILGKAFSGELAPQDPDEEPIGNALNRVRSRRPVNAPAKTSKKGNTMRSKKQDVELEATEGWPLAELGRHLQGSGAMRLLRLNLNRHRYKALAPFDEDWEFVTLDSALKSEARRIEPICLVGINGSGKSQFLEFVSEIFCYLERLTSPLDVSAKGKNSPIKDWEWEIEYMLPQRPTDAELNVGGSIDILPPHHVKVVKGERGNPRFYVLDAERNAVQILNPHEQFQLLPVRCVGYSSGQNETLSPSFSRLRSIYAAKVYGQAKQSGVTPQVKLPFTRSIFVDYDANSTVVLANYLLGSEEHRRKLGRFTRVQDLSSFRLAISFDKRGYRPRVLRTDELDQYVENFIACATSVEMTSEIDDKDWRTDFPAWELEFVINEKTRQAFKERFGTAKALFIALQKLNYLNLLGVKEEEQRRYDRGELLQVQERAPTPLSSELVFRIEEMLVTVEDENMPLKIIPYSGLSDGEHQFLHIAGTIILMDEPGTLFLFDEPETHFNPQWRARFIKELNELVGERKQEFIFSTHSPFMVSDCRGSNVYSFYRRDGLTRFKRAGFETYGSSFQILLKRLFMMESLVSDMSHEDLLALANETDINLDDLETKAQEFGESFEKRVIYERIAEMQE